jgi:mRNA interferase RelE/StbE
VTDERYQVRYTHTARRALSDDLPLPVVDAVLALIDGDLTTRPARIGKPLRPPLAGTWSARRGTYRILYEIDNTKRTVTITAIEARSDAYRPR